MQCGSESQRLLGHLGALKIDPQAKGGQRLAKALGKAVKSLYKRKDVEQCRKNLTELNGQLSAAILLSLHQKGVYPSNLSWAEQIATRPRDVDKATLLSERLRQRLQQQHIIDGLSFNGLTARREAIDAAFPTTYEWALQNDFDLRDWFRDSGGIFWITGKAGSGKSTLTKFLSNHEETKKLLATWSSQQQLITASFFFWYAGTTLQKSILGLLRSILHQIISCDRELAEVAFPARYHTFDPITKETSQQGDWTYEELVEGLKEISSPKNAAGSRTMFCLFIDGLDEYYGNHLELVALLKNLVRNPCVKLCVSSRPWNAFRSTFGSHTPQLRLEDLSRPDIFHYADQSIRQGLALIPTGQYTEDGNESDALIGEIVAKADGVFL